MWTKLAFWNGLSLAGAGLLAVPADWYLATWWVFEAAASPLPTTVQP